MVILWDVAAGRKTTTLATDYRSVAALAFAPDGKTLAVGGVTQQASTEAGTIRFWDIKADLAKSAVYPGTAFHGRGVLALAYLPGGKQIASAGKDTLIRRWDNVSAAPRGRLLGDLGWIAALAATTDGMLVSGSYDRTVKVWDSGAPGAVQVLHGHKDWVQALAFAGRAEQVLVSGGKDGLVKLWDPLSGAARGELPAHAGAVTALAVSPVKPDVIAVGTWDSKGGGEINLWELAREEKGPGFKGKKLHTLKAPAGIVCLSFSRGASGQLASAVADKTVIIWDTDKGKPLHTLAGKQGQVRAR